MPLMVMVTRADYPDRAVARDLLLRLRLLHPQLTPTWADSAYSGVLVDWSKRSLRLTLKIVNRPPGQSGFVVLPRLMWNLICQAWHYGSAVDIDWPVPR
ncbi:hypothetical protein SAMN05444920_11822 [Nonomuraea solani]|uniref:Transposase DDE domain-containing protein n=1 Tax=Nonomuraea solani TaxID=1144553 RepID=A0A1H6ETV2_9ACTN|nr:hypothetical protein SAMN05444920_11822 [Nonomuraea solani]